MMNEKIKDTIAYKYASDVMDNKITVGYLVRLAVKRFFNDLDREDLDIDLKQYRKALKFFSLFHHYTGKFNGIPFVLSPWLDFILFNLIAFKYNKGERKGTRKYRLAFIFLARKLGKTAFSAILGLYYCLADGEPAAEVCLGANSRNLANIIYTMMETFLRLIDPKLTLTKCLRNEIKVPSTNSHILALSSDSSRLDGLNCSIGIIDEFAFAPDSSLRDVIKSSMGTRKNPMLITISTPGLSSMNNPAYEARCLCKEILEGEKTDDNIFAFLAEMDEGAEWKDIESEECQHNWICANPNYGVTVDMSWLKQMVQAAVNQPSLELECLAKTLGCWVTSTKQQWIPLNYLDSCYDKVNLMDFKDRLNRIGIGIDLGSTSDLTAVAYLVYPEDLESVEEKLYLKIDYYLPEAALETSPIGDFYREMAKQGYLIVTDGNVCDYNVIVKDLTTYEPLLYYDRLLYDKWNSTQFIVNLNSLSSIDTYPFAQGLGSFNMPTKYFERMILTGLLVIDYNPITDFCFKNVVLATDRNFNIKPTKPTIKKNGSMIEDRSKKIDGIIAAIQSVAAFIIYCGECGYGSNFDTFSIGN